MQVNPGECRSAEFTSVWDWLLCDTTALPSMHTAARVVLMGGLLAVAPFLWHQILSHRQTNRDQILLYSCQADSR